MGFSFTARNSNKNEPHSPEPEGAPNTAALGRTARERLLKSQGQNRLPKRRRTKMAICTFNARTLASEACIEDLMMQARKIKYDVIGLTETRRHRPLHAVFETGEELFLGTCDSKGVGGVGVLVNTHLAMNIDSYESLTTRIGRLRLRRCGSTPALTIFVAYAPTSSYEEEELEAFYMDLERLYREDHTFFKVIVAPGPDRIKPEHLKSIPQVIIKTLARLFTRYLSECKVPTSWKTSKTVLLYKKGDPDDIGNYRPICLLSVIYKLFTRVILNRIGRILDEGQPCEQAGFRKGFSTIDHIHTLTRLIEVSREYKMPLCLTFIDSKKAFDTVETEAVIEALGNQGVPTQYIRMLRELYDNFTTRISPFYKEVIINVKRGVRQGDTISPKLFSAALENIMRHLEWEDLE
uniref:Reverse transcriptase domain-containing protein n=1 Tax=Haemonchus contortus TaxID=6289 RepID=A0A7I4Z723_HAECO